MGGYHTGCGLRRSSRKAAAPENCAPANLKAMCQGCHLHYDQDHHARARAEARHARARSLRAADVRAVGGPWGVSNGSAASSWS